MHFKFSFAVNQQGRESKEENQEMTTDNLLVNCATEDKLNCSSLLLDISKIQQDAKSNEEVKPNCEYIFPCQSNCPNFDCESALKCNCKSQPHFLSQEIASHQNKFNTIRLSAGEILLHDSASNRNTSEDSLQKSSVLSKSWEFSTEFPEHSDKASLLNESNASQEDPPKIHFVSRTSTLSSEYSSNWENNFLDDFELKLDNKDGQTCCKNAFDLQNIPRIHSNGPFKISNLIESDKIDEEFIIDVVGDRFMTYNEFMASYEALDLQDPHFMIQFLTYNVSLVNSELELNSFILILDFCSLNFPNSFSSVFRRLITKLVDSSQNEFVVSSLIERNTLLVTDFLTPHPSNLRMSVKISVQQTKFCNYLHFHPEIIQSKTIKRLVEQLRIIIKIKNMDWDELSRYYKMYYEEYKMHSGLIFIALLEHDLEGYFSDFMGNPNESDIQMEGVVSRDTDQDIQHLQTKELENYLQFWIFLSQNKKYIPLVMKNSPFCALEAGKLVELSQTINAEVQQDLFKLLCSKQNEKTLLKIVLKHRIYDFSASLLTWLLEKFKSEFSIAKFLMENLIIATQDQLNLPISRISNKNIKSLINLQVENFGLKFEMLRENDAAKIGNPLEIQQLSISTVTENLIFIRPEGADLYIDCFLLLMTGSISKKEEDEISSLSQYQHVPIIQLLKQNYC